MSFDDSATLRMVKIGAAAAALRVSVDTLRRWERAGKVTFERRENHRYMPATDLANLLRERNAQGLTSARKQLQGSCWQSSPIGLWLRPSSPAVVTGSSR
jgi:hypothetical protein